MKKTWIGAGTVMLVALALASFASAADKKGPWIADFKVDKSELSSTGHAPYFVLEPGYQLVFEGGKERLVITVLGETKMVDGVETRVVEERETAGGQLTEVSRNYFAINKHTNDVFYFGEEVDMYKDGKVANHDGSWLAGVEGAKFGMAMPGRAFPGARYYQEIASEVAMDRAEVTSITKTFATPAGEFKNCLVVEETSSLEPGKEYKYYAPGVGLVRDGAVKLVKYGQAEKPEN